MDSGDEGEMWLLWIFGEISRQIFHTETKQDSAHQINWDFFCEMRAADELRMVDSGHVSTRCFISVTHIYSEWRAEIHS